MANDSTIIRDPVHGTIELTEIERKILDTAPMQRLRHVRQLGMAHLVYPGAHHTRFEHSLGCLHLADQMATSIRLGEDDRRRLRLAALLHDVGHLAFSHDSESVTWKRLGDHEKRGQKLVQKSPLADIISREEKPATIARWLQGASYGQLLTSDVGADRIDYLLRDAHYTGVAYGVVDSARIRSTLRWSAGAPALREGGLEAAESLIMARFEMFHAVYYHHTVRIIRSMLQAAILEALQDKEVDWAAAQGDGDQELLERVSKLPAARAWIKKLHERKLHKRALMVPLEKLGKSQKRLAENGQMAEELSEACSCQVLVSYPDPFKSHTTIAMLMADGPLPLEEASPLVASLQEAAEGRAQLLIAAPQRQADKVENAARKFLGL